MLFFCGCKEISEVSNATISYSYNKDGFIFIPIEDGKYLFLDTGFTMSVLFRDRIKINSTFRRFALINWRRLALVRRVDTLQIGDLIINNHNFVFTRSKNTHHKNDSTIVGIIGMDILSKKYSYFDIKNQTITFSDEKKAQTRLPILVLTYQSPTRPVSSLRINGTMFENVLFDTGFNCFLALLENDKVKLNNQNNLQQALNTDFLGNQRVVCIGQFDFIQMNDINFQAQAISFGHRIRMLGMRFVMQFSSFSIDPFEKKIKFFE